MEVWFVPRLGAPEVETSADGRTRKMYLQTPRTDDELKQAMDTFKEKALEFDAVLTAQALAAGSSGESPRHVFRAQEESRWVLREIRDLSVVRAPQQVVETEPVVVTDPQPEPVESLETMD